jgi:hypothetical protein
MTTTQTKNKKSISEPAAIALLGRLFGRYPARDAITLEEAYSAFGRSDIDPTTNRNWLNGTLGKLKEHQLVTSVLEFADGRNKLVAIKLTTAGRVVLKRTHDDSLPSSISETQEETMTTQADKSNSWNLDDVLEAVEDLKLRHPRWEIVFEIKPKGGAS